MELIEKNLSIKVYLRGYGEEVRESYPVYMRILYMRKKADVSLKLQAKPEDWDFEEQMYKSVTQYNKYNNNTISKIQAEVEGIYKGLKYSGEAVTLDKIRQVMKGEVSSSSKMKFLEYYDLFVNECKARPNENGPGVISHYAKTRRHLYNYMLKKKMLEITLVELNRNFIVGFEQHLLSTPIEGKEQAMQKSTASTYLRKLKHSVNKAVLKEFITVNPFAGYTISTHRMTKVTYLNDEEIVALKAHTLGANRSLLKVRDFFLFSVYTGLRYSDAIALTASNVRKDDAGNMWIYIDQQKTRARLEVPMIDQAIELYDKYKDEREQTNFILPRICSQKINTYLKTIGDLVGIEKRLTHHVARHTFATTVTLEKGIDLKSVSRLLGHSSIKSTEIYAQVTNRKLLSCMHTLNKKV
jgi:integrase/recombinase XerD